MAGSQHRLERRAQLLSTRMRERVDAVRDAVAAPGQRLPFHTVKSRTEALAWWTKHRHDDLGKKVLSSWSTEEIAALDAALATAAEPLDLRGEPPTAA